MSATTRIALKYWGAGLAALVAYWGIQVGIELARGRPAGELEWGLPDGAAIFGVMTAALFAGVRAAHAEGRDQAAGGPTASADG